MQTLSRTEDIEAGCDPEFERRWWRIQRIIWGILVLLLLAGVAGVFGHGPLSEATIHPSGSQLQVRYDPLARRETPSILKLSNATAVSPYSSRKSSSRDKPGAPATGWTPRRSCGLVGVHD
ncbi:MAG TPA: hypothetical protein VMF69_11850 [Gemmataceae bacterium]|nr:hypothetical protein [Gemmataceae bacterium]